MRYLPIELRREYERLTNECSNVEGIISPLINVSDVLRAYVILADYFSDSSGDQKVETMLFGLRDYNLLASAVSRQVVSLGAKLKYTEPLDICATLFFGLVKNHAFADGNKRTALLTLLYQLQMYSFLPHSKIKEYERLVIAVAAGILESEYPNVWIRFQNDPDAAIMTISFMLKKMTIKKDHGYVSMNMKELREAIKKYNTICEQDEGKIHFARTTKSLDGMTQTLKYSLVFGGWTRTVGVKQVRILLEALKIYEEIPDYNVFLAGGEPMYRLISDFEGPLRRLKDR